ncbi:heterokaryon incompatibility protein-domain-containing protein [Truncatella angustata]|uniref:Heterokaryon incompatibility protein-domain-containing protein n=1 Tax=Truncatella angustata TaxID=152316 RepID=A0A9P8RF39_9PEZI|nr:heterokaryon incompatibility protein-domain-containing protein [Truncatella angustata]KAH6643268.1 heterokaryon incompatibility protein-domain-containing protein [Truncatella angustata]
MKGTGWRSGIYLAGCFLARADRQRLYSIFILYTVPSQAIPFLLPVPILTAYVYGIMRHHSHYPARHGLMATFSLLDNHSQQLVLCIHCKKLQIQVIAEEQQENTLAGYNASEHILRQEYEDIFPKLPRMEDRAANGCSLCKFIRSAVLAEYQRRRLDLACETKPGRILLEAQFTEKFQHKSSLSIYKNGGPHIIQVKAPGLDAHGGIHHIEFEIAVQISAEPTLTTRNPLATKNVECIKRWVQACQLSHDICRSKLSGYIPTRVLEVKNEILRLVTRGTDSRKYAALSYCWGTIPEGKKGFLTIKNNLASRLLGFSLHELPKTLQEAIRVVRAIDIEYIWIDALCIVQDDSVDWAQESSQMAQIYGNADVTIAATTSESSFDGFLQDRKPSYRWSSNFIFKEVQSFRSNVLVEQLGTIHFRYPLEASVAKHLATCRWETRGWTLQEKLLSARTLYFTKDVIYFECATTQELENQGYKLPERNEFSILIAKSRAISLIERLSKRDTYLSRWYDIVAMYTRRNVTVEADKLLAMDGLAAALKDMIDDIYVYGLWRTDLHRGLLWSTSYRSPQRHLRGAYRAPTWSWACRDGPVLWDKSTCQPGWKSLIRVIDMLPHCKCSCNETKGAQLELTAEVAPLKDVLLAFLQPRINEYEWYKDGWDTVSAWDEFDGLGTFVPDDDSEELYLPGTQIMLVAERKAPDNIQALLIQPDRDMSKFQRVGWFIQQSHHQVDADFDDESEASAGDVNYSEDFGPLRKLFKLERLTLV